MPSRRDARAATAEPAESRVAGDLAALLAGSAVDAAPRLLGWRLRARGGGVCATITETEAYHTAADRACHAHKGRTPRSEGLYGAAGTLYVYRCYGIHWLFNIVCAAVGVPSAVLIRGVVAAGVDPRTTNGPAKVAVLLGLDGQHHGSRLGTAACPIELLPPLPVAEERRRPEAAVAPAAARATAALAATAAPAMRCGPRVGVASAGPEWAGKPWRWWTDGFPAAGVPRRPAKEADGKTAGTPRKRPRISDDGDDRAPRGRGVAE